MKIKSILLLCILLIGCQNHAKSTGEDLRPLTQVVVGDYFLIEVTTPTLVAEGEQFVVQTSLTYLGEEEVELSYNGPIRIYFDGNADNYAYTDDEQFQIINQGYQFKQETELEAGERGTYQLIFDPHFKVERQSYNTEDMEIEPMEITIK